MLITKIVLKEKNNPTKYDVIMTKTHLIFYTLGQKPKGKFELLHRSQRFILQIYQ